jgi:hypothetical protein
MQSNNTAGDTNTRLVSYIGTSNVTDFSDVGSASWIDIFTISGSTGNTGTYRNGFYAEDSLTIGAPTRFGNIFDDTLDTNYIDGVAQGGTASATGLNWASPGTITVSSAAYNFATGGFWNGPISEIVITNTALSPTDRTNLDNYFKAKWGL